MITELTTRLSTAVQSLLTDLDWSRFVAAVIVLALFTVARQPLANGSLYLIRAILGHFKFDFSDSLRRSIQLATELFIFGIGLLIFVNMLQIGGSMGAIAEKIAISVLVAAVFSAAYGSAGLAASLLVGTSDQVQNVSAGWVEKILKVLAIGFGIASVLRVWGIDLGPLMTGVGIAGAATALAAQDLIKNFVGGMSNMAERRFEVGDWIRAEAVVEGVVEDVSLRSTAVRQFDLSLVHVPNGDLANAPLINISKMRHRRINMRVKLHYGTGVEQLAEITKAVQAYVAASERFAQPPEVSQYICVVELDDKAIDLMVYCFTKSTVYADYLAAREALILEIKRIVSANGARFAYESRNFVIENAREFGVRPGE